MPFAILKNIYAVNSEDTSHPASSLLKNESNRKWKTAKNEKSANVVIQLENELTITGIDIGNEHSAFVEVLVGKTKKCDEFKEILLTSSLMTPIESKNSTNINRVRCFPKSQLIESVADEKWDLVKFVCTQPFNKHCQYGLSFVKIHVAESKENKTLVPDKFLQHNSLNNNDEKSTNAVSKFMGKFKLREESPDSDSDNCTSLFNRWKYESKTSENIKKPLSGSTAAAIREASTPNSLKRNAECLKPTKIIQKPDSKPIDVDALDKKRILDRNRNDLLYDENDDKPSDKYDRRISLDQERFSKEKEKEKDRKFKEKQNKDTSKETSSQKNSDTSISVQKREKDSSISSKFKNFFGKEEETDDEPKPLTPKTDKHVKKISIVNNSAKKRLSSPINKSSPAKKIKNEKDFHYKPFSKLLDGVVLTISGIQNPERADIRSKALAMGAKYKPDWESSCTHLICAFKNTPKYLQVQQANGKIVTRKWIETCYKAKKRIPWRRYALEESENDQQESEEEILDITMKPSSAEQSPRKSSSPEPSTSSKKYLSPAPTNNRRDTHENTLSRYDIVQDDDLKDETYHVLSSGSDTEEEIERVRQKQKLEVSEKPTTKNNYENMETEDLFFLGEKNITKEIDKRDIFEISTEEEEFTKQRRQQKESKHFFQNKKFYLTSKLTAVDKMKLKSIIEQYHGELIESLRQANYVISKEELEISNIQGIVVSPLWIYECNDMESLIPTQRYLV